MWGASYRKRTEIMKIILLGNINIFPAIPRSSLSVSDVPWGDTTGLRNRRGATGGDASAHEDNTAHRRKYPSPTSQIRKSKQFKP